MPRLLQDDLVGTESRVEELTNLSSLGSDNDVRVVEISGVGDIGKTTLAGILYERINHKYNFPYFINDVNKIYRDSKSLGVLNELISKSSNEKNFKICNAIFGDIFGWEESQ